MTATRWPARLEHLEEGALVDRLPRGSELWIDGGHNPDAARLVAAHAERNWRDGLPLVILFASLKSKDAAATLAPFVGSAARIITLPIPGHDCREPAELAAMARSAGLSAEPQDDLESALSSVTAQARVLVFGSLYLAGVALAANGSLPD
jgi:dihydrofolate synthase/folylpolyglutamate synthase